MGDAAEAPGAGAAVAMDRDTIAKLTRLARLTTTASEEARLLDELRRILAYMERLRAADLQDVPPTTHAVALPQTLRDDEVRPGLSIDEAMRNAPERLGDGFGVPKIIE